jgi:hypothetical protein
LVCTLAGALKGVISTIKWQQTYSFVPKRWIAFDRAVAVADGSVRSLGFTGHLEK